MNGSFISILSVLHLVPFPIYSVMKDADAAVSLESGLDFLCWTGATVSELTVPVTLNYLAYRSKELAHISRRAKIINKGLIYSPGHGDIAFIVPMFDDFLTRIFADDVNAFRGDAS